MAWTSWILVAFLSLARADYLFELDLQQYANPGGKNFRDVCCEGARATNPQTGQCLTVDTCDPKFSIRLINFNRQGQGGQQSRLGQDYILGTFQDSDSVTFSNCQPIQSDTSSAGVLNPLSFVFTNSDFTPGEHLRVITDITHTEGNNNDPIVINFVQPLGSISGTNSTFSSSMTFFASAPSTLTLQLRYRLICTSGSCGSDCSQTTGCPTFPQACVPSCNQSTPCLNEGTCQNGLCICTANYEGARCGSAITTTAPMVTTIMTLPTTMTTPTQTELSTSAATPNNNVDDIEQETSATSTTTASMDRTDTTSGGTFLKGSILLTLVVFLFIILYP